MTDCELKVGRQKNKKTKKQKHCILRIPTNSSNSS